MSWGRSASGTRAQIEAFLAQLSKSVAEVDGKYASEAVAATHQKQTVLAGRTIQDVMDAHPDQIYNFSISAHGNDDGGGFVSVSYGFQPLPVEEVIHSAEGEE